MATHFSLQLLIVAVAAGLFVTSNSCQLAMDAEAAETHRAANAQRTDAPPTADRDTPEEPEDLPEQESDLPVVPAEQLLPLEPQKRTFEIVAGDDRGDLMPMILREARQEEPSEAGAPGAPGEPGEWVLEMDDLNILFLEKDDEGNVLIVRMDLPREQYMIVYDPPVRLIPSRLVPDLRVEEYAQARVYDPQTRELQHTGEVTHTIKRVTRARFDTPDGLQEGYMVITEHAIDLGPADIELEMEAGYLPGDGLVYRHIRYTVTRLGIFGNTTRRTAILVE